MFLFKRTLLDAFKLQAEAEAMIMKMNRQCMHAMRFVSFVALAHTHGAKDLALRCVCSKTSCMLQTGPDALADELWQNILCHLSLTEVLNSSRVCKRWHSISQHDAVWQCLYASEFGLPKAPSLITCWKQAFCKR